MAHWPLQTGVVRQLSTMRAANNFPSGTPLTASATPHTKGVWSEIIASTAAGVRLLVLNGVTQVVTAATDTAMLLDVAIGAALSETVILENYNVGEYTFGVTPGPFLYLPLVIPAGSRISARIQSKVVSDTFGLGIETYGGIGLNSLPVAGVAVDTLGTDLANSRGTAVVTGASNVFGAWVQVSASTPNPYRAVWVAGGLGGDTNTNDALTLEVGVGAVAAEQTISSCTLFATASEGVENKLMEPVPHAWSAAVPAGQRLAVRAKSSGPTSSPADISVYGLRG